MSLVKYHKKRNFKVTAEPEGKVGAKKRTGLRYVIQKHAASRLHYDFRLELDGTLKSWAVPKGPSLDPSRKALAVQVEDHPVEYGDFEGVIPKGQYGGGTVLLWDRGTWEPVGDAREGLKKGKLVFVLHGEKLKGEWTLVRMQGKAGEGGKNWLLIKHKDEYVEGRDILAEEPQSVKTRRSMEDIGEERDEVWDAGAKRAAELPGAKKSGMPARLSPQLATLVEHPPEGEEWIHEIKFDGYRLMAFVKSGEVTLRTRTGLDWTAKFPTVARSLAKLAADSAIVDGEVVMLDKEGRSDFQALQGFFKAKEKGTPTYFAFDLPFCDGVDLRNVALIERKKMLKALLDKSDLPADVAYSDHVRGSGETVIAKACEVGSEGIVSKLADSPYVGRRERSWVKCKCGQRQEFVIVGYTRSEKRAEGLRSLLLGYHAAGGGLVYSGRVGTGFDSATLNALYRRLKGLEQGEAPMEEVPPVRERRAARWVKPTLVCEVAFSGWTEDGRLRHPVFMGLREDKKAGDVKREKVERMEAVNGHGTTQVRAKAAKVARSAKNGSEASEGVAGVRLTHPDKVLYPADKVTKGQVAAYYERVQEFMMPHVVERPLSVVRCPAGLATKCFMARNWTESMPKAIDKVQVGASKNEMHILVHDLGGVISLVQISALEIHTWNCKGGDVEHPDQLVFDLDPGPEVAWKKVKEGARVLRGTLENLGMTVFLKTTGGKGLHLTVPIVPKVGWTEVKAFCKTLAEHQAGEADVFITNMRKDLRGGKIFLDYLRNGRGATAIAPYSTRARAGAAVSMPISWEELNGLKSADQFRVGTVESYLEKRKGDPWEGFERSRVDLGKIVSGKSGVH